MEKKPELLVSLLESVDERLEASKVTEQFVNSQYPHHSHQPHYLTSLPYDLIVLQLLQDEGEVEREESHEVN